MSSHVHISGYHVPFKKVREAMSKLKIPDKDVEDMELEYPISDWLAKNNKRYPLPVAFDHPNDTAKANGILFITRITLCKSKSNPPDSNADAGKYSPVVKSWMINEGGLKDEDLAWVALWDDDGLTDDGFIPRENSRQGPIFRPTPEEVAAFYKSGKHPREIISFIKERREKEGQNLST